MILNPSFNFSMTVMKKELDTIVNLGALVGAVLGVLNIIT